MASQGLDDPQAEAIWGPFLQWVAEAGLDIAFLTPPVLRSGPARHRWDPPFLKARLTSGAAPASPFWKCSSIGQIRPASNSASASRVRCSVRSSDAGSQTDS
jgi:hypothetical protein